MTLPSWPADRPLREWQRAAAAAVFSHPSDAFLASATPAAGKTTFGLHVAHRMLAEGRVARVAVVAPTTHIARQWAADAARYGLDLEPNRPNAAGPEPRDRHGVAVTYQTVAAGPAVHRRRCAEAPTLLIADEPHHMGDQAAWGRSTRRGVRPRALPAAAVGHAVPHRRHADPVGELRRRRRSPSPTTRTATRTRCSTTSAARSRSTSTTATWSGCRTAAAAPPTSRVGLPAAEAARRLRTALDPDGDWIAHVLRDAVLRLERIRAGAHPDAGGLVVAADKEHADALAERLARVAGEPPEVVTSDAPDASARIARFAAGSGTWLVSVLMVSEGVDIPRLRVGVYATSARTELFFRQVVGRFIRRTPAPREQMSHVFLPADPTLKRLAAQVEEERRHALALEPQGEPLAEPVERVRSEPGDAFRALSSSAHGEAEMLQTTQPGRDAVAVRGRPAAVARAGGVHDAPRPAASAGAPSRPAGRDARTSGASACATSAARWSRRSRA